MLVFDIVFVILMFVLGAVFGSFACCQAWRLRYKAAKKKNLGKRSVCLSCNHQLEWYDNVPIISWLTLKGKCRYCHKKIGKAELWSEVLFALTFLGLGLKFILDANFGSLSIIHFIVLLIFVVVIGTLAIYDAKWGELPMPLLIASIIIGVVLLVIQQFITGWSLGSLISALVGVLILALPMFLLYKLSHEKLMGGGDWWLALAIALALGNWWLALWVMFLSNALGCIVMLPKLSKEKKHVVYFGPFLVAGFIVIFLLSGLLQLLI